MTPPRPSRWSCTPPPPLAGTRPPPWTSTTSGSLASTGLPELTGLGVLPLGSWSIISKYLTTVDKTAACGHRYLQDRHLLGRQERLCLGEAGGWVLETHSRASQDQQVSLLWAALD